jgi:hypothetical protein
VTLLIWQRYIIVAVPIIGYPLIYFKLRKVYLENIEQQKPFLKEEEQL